MRVYIVDDNDIETAGRVIDSDFSGYDQLVIPLETINEKAIDLPAPEDFAEVMQMTWDRYSIDEAHKIADVMISNMLTLLGYKKGIEIFTNADKWYE